MPNHELEYHGNHLAVNVKVNINLNKPELELLAKRLGLDWDDFTDEVWNQLCELFWMQTAQDLARQYGFEGVQAEGRSNGWCVPIYGGNPVERTYLDNVMDEEATEIMKNYFLFRFKIKEVIKDSKSRFEFALKDDLEQRELDFLLVNSLSARTMHFEIFGVRA